jgi:hypothetical protein
VHRAENRPTDELTIIRGQSGLLGFTEVTSKAGGAVIAADADEPC